MKERIATLNPSVAGNPVVPRLATGDYALSDRRHRDAALPPPAACETITAPPLPALPIEGGRRARAASRRCWSSSTALAPTTVAHKAVGAMLAWADLALALGPAHAKQVSGGSIHPRLRPCCCPS
jgi:hypothetical protein